MLLRESILALLSLFAAVTLVLDPFTAQSLGCSASQQAAVRCFVANMLYARIRRSVRSSASGTVHKIVLARSKTEPAKAQVVDPTTNCVETC